MRQKRSIKTFAVISAFAALLSGPVVAQTSFLNPQEGVNGIIVGVGSAPDFMGSDDNKAVPAVMARIYLGQTRRYVQLLGTQLSLNLLNSEGWQLGPQLNFRSKRDSDVDDPVIARMRPVDSEVEAGIFVGHTWRLSGDPRHRFGLRADVQSGEGSFGTATANLWWPVSKAVVLNLGGGFAYASGKWTDHYFGVNGTDIALFPSLGGAPYVAGSGIYDFRFNAGAVIHLSPKWHVGVGMRYQQLQGDAADSPIVKQRGNRDQFIFGAAVGYVWQ